MTLAPSCFASRTPALIALRASLEPSVGIRTRLNIKRSSLGNEWAGRHRSRPGCGSTAKCEECHIGQRADNGARGSEPGPRERQIVNAEDLLGRATSGHLTDVKSAPPG